MKITLTLKVLPTFLQNFPLAKITMFTVLLSTTKFIKKEIFVMSQRCIHSVLIMLI